MNPATSSSIKLLPEHIVNQIKAGEVIERPASLLKELIENSIDAKASKIHIQIKDNGLGLISIEDDGIGMTIDDLPYAFCRHATSKITNFEDLYKLHSFGFRGEALASMASVGRITCHSVPVNDPDLGGKIIINGGEQESVIPYSGTQHGTSIFINDLFFNTPVRLKFTRSKTSEKNALKKTLNSFIIYHFEKHFTVKWDDKDKEVYRPCKTPLERICQTLPGKIDPTEFLIIDQNYEGHKIEAYVSQRPLNPGQQRGQYLFVNDRYFEDKQLHYICLRQLEKIWGPGKSGHYIIKIYTPPNELDVNVHPNKTQVKFSRMEVVTALLSNGLKNALSSISLPQEEILATEQQEQINFNHPVTSSRPVRPEFSFESTNPTKPDTASSMAQLTDSFFIDLRGETREIIDAKSLLIDYWLGQYKNSPTNEELSVTPLIIGHPFKFTKVDIGPYQYFLKERGFDTDFIDGKTLILRTVPTYLSPIYNNDVFAAILTELVKSDLETKQPKNMDFGNLIKKAVANTSQPISISQLQYLLNTHPNKNKFIAQITEDKIADLFNE